MQVGTEATCSVPDPRALLSENDNLAVRWSEPSLLMFRVPAALEPGRGSGDLGKWVEKWMGGLKIADGKCRQFLTKPDCGTREE